MAFKTKYLNCRYNYCRIRPVARIFGFGGKIHFRGEKIFDLSCLKQIFLSTTKFSKAQERFVCNCPRMLHRVCGPGQNRRHSVFHWGPSCLCRGVERTENLFLIYSMNSICRLRKLIINNFPQILIIGS